MRNLRHRHDPNTLPDHMKKFIYYVMGEKVEEDAVYEFPTMTIIGKFLSAFFAEIFFELVVNCN